MAKQTDKHAGKPDRAAWPADQVERWPLTRLRAYERNSKRHSDLQIEQIAASIRQWGWTIPVLVDEGGTILAGHARVEAGRLIGVAEVPVIVARGWSEAQKAAYVIADNKLPEGGRWDDAMLALEIGALQENGDFDIGLTGLTDGDLKRLNGEEDRVVVQEIATSDVRDEFWISIRGPLEHQADVLAKLRATTQGLAGVSVDLGTIAME